jgi:sugar (pentulose or hexulose) kinase
MDLRESFTVVVDIGKTLAKVSLWSANGRMLDRQARPNQRCTVDGIARLDAGGIAAWLPQALAKYGEHPIEAIIPVAHGAGIAAIKDGTLAFAPIDYEAEPPQEIRHGYLAERDSFALTGSPALPAGLNLGVQLYWLERRDPGCLDGCTLVPWAQYWAWVLSGVAVSEVTSLGCHSDLWSPSKAGFSPLAERMGWAKRLAPLARADEAIGVLRPDLASATGLPTDTAIYAGLHDSNAAMLAARGFPNLADRDVTVLSTGTWFVAMRHANEALNPADLLEARDCLVNVDPFGKPLQSARFMGGREIETLIELDTRQVDIKPDQARLLGAVPDLLGSKAMVLPTLAPGCGPFPNSVGGWVDRPDDWYARRAGACLYAALTTDAALHLIGSRDALVVEGRFAEAEVFVRALAALRPQDIVYVANEHNDVALGALRLLDPELAPASPLQEVEPLHGDLADYRDRWLARIEAAG